MLFLRKIIIAASLFFTLFFQACIPKPLQLSPTNYRIENIQKPDSALTQMLRPYKDSLSKNMTAVIGFSLYGLTKKQPESNLGNFMTDAMKTMAEQKFGKKVDAAFINYGGIRSYIPKGDVTISKIYELMPFDNLVVLQQLSGADLAAFVNHIASRGGWPVAGITYSIKDKKADNILVDGKPLDLKASYTIANSDYIANGGDNCEMLKKIPQQNISYILRDALIEYVKKQTADGKSIDVQIQNRVVYGN